MVIVATGGLLLGLLVLVAEAAELLQTQEMSECKDDMNWGGGLCEQLHGGSLLQREAVQAPSTFKASVQHEAAGDVIVAYEADNQTAFADIDEAEGKIDETANEADFKIDDTSGGRRRRRRKGIEQMNSAVDDFIKSFDTGMKEFFFLRVFFAFYWFVLRKASPIPSKNLLKTVQKPAKNLPQKRKRRS